MAAYRRIANLFCRSRLDGDIAAELEAHIQLRTDDNIAQGMAPTAARREALLRFGNPTSTRERVAAADSNLNVEKLVRDLRLSLRQLRKSPAFGLTAIFTLAIGIGGVTAAYSVVEAVLLRPLPFYKPERLVRLHEGIERQLESADLPAP